MVGSKHLQKTFEYLQKTFEYLQKHCLFEYGYSLILIHEHSFNMFEIRMCFF